MNGEYYSKRTCDGTSIRYGNDAKKGFRMWGESNHVSEPSRRGTFIGYGEYYEKYRHRHYDRGGSMKDFGNSKNK